VDTHTETSATRDATLDRVLLVCDWTVDPHAVVAAASRRNGRTASAFALVVPAWLHGLDWAGDPLASGPCACEQQQAISSLLDAAGLRVERAEVGDPDPTSAIEDALAVWPADEILVFTRERRRARGPFGLARRVARATGVPVARVRAPRTAGGRRRGLRRRAGHCVAAAS
jgi:hypothetical protein